MGDDVKKSKEDTRRVFVLSDVSSENEFAVFANLAMAYSYPAQVPMIIVKGCQSEAMENLLFELSRMTLVVRVTDDYQIANTLQLCPNLIALDICKDVLVIKQMDLVERPLVAVIRSVGRPSLGLVLGCLMYCNKLFKHVHIVGDLGKAINLVESMRAGGMSISHEWALDGVGPMAVRMFEFIAEEDAEQMVLTLPDDFAFRAGDIMSLIGRLISYKDTAWSVTSFPRERFMDEKLGLIDCRHYPILALDMCLMRAKLAVEFLKYATAIAQMEYLAEDLVLTKIVTKNLGLKVGFADDAFRAYHLKGIDSFNRYHEVPDVQLFYRDVCSMVSWSVQDVIDKLVGINQKVGEFLRLKGGNNV